MVADVFHGFNSSRLKVQTFRAPRAPCFAQLHTSTRPPALIHSRNFGSARILARRAECEPPAQACIPMIPLSGWIATMSMKLKRSCRTRAY